MSGNIRLYNTGGYVELQAPSSATNQTLVLPTDSIQPGLVHLHTETFSAVSSVSIDNVFSTEYDNYKIIVRNLGGNEDLLLRLRSNGSDSTTNYSQQITDFNGTSVSTNRTTPTGANTGINTNGGFISTEISGPNLSATTSIISHCSTPYNGSFNRFGVIIHSLSTSYDGFTLIPGGAGTISGTLRIYGYRNA